MSSYFNTNWDLVGDYSGINNAPFSRGTNDFSRIGEAFLKSANWLNNRNRYRNASDYNFDEKNNYSSQSSPYIAKLGDDFAIYTPPPTIKGGSSGGRSGGIGGIISGAGSGLLAGLSTGIPHAGAIGAITGAFSGLS